MYLRVTTFQSDPAKIEAGISIFRNTVVPTLSTAPGYLGASCVVDREISRAGAGTLWESLQAMNNAEQAGAQARLESSQSVGLEVIDVDRFEITVMHMAEPSATLPAYTRLVSAYCDPARAEAAIAILREQSLPLLQKQPGYRAFVSGINRMTGRAFTSTSFATAAQREASDAVLEETRKRVVDAGGLYGRRVSLVETVVAEVKVPATA